MAGRSKTSRKKSAKRSKTRTKRNPSRGWRSGLLRLTLYGFGVLLIAGVGYGLYLDHVVRQQFQGRRWELPARVYARPLELFAGRRLTRDDLAHELDLLHYQRSRTAAQAGAYSRNGARIDLTTRAFRYWDGSEPSQHVRVRFDNGEVAGLSDDQGKSLPLVRLDPVLIGSVYPAHNEDRILVKLEDVPPLLTKTLIAVEDRSFYQHHGVAPMAIARAIWANLRAGQTVQGGSTLTQQLVKNFFLSNERTLVRKLNEAAMALLLELHYDKNEILETYLNEVYLGQDGRRSINGFGLASYFYFERPLAQLRAHEIALLVGMIKGPSYYDPRRHPKRALIRRNLVLDLMAAQGVLGDADAARAKQQPLDVVAEPPSGTTLYPNFVELVRRQLRRDYRDEDLTSEGLQIFTTLDPIVQRQAEQALSGELHRLEGPASRPRGSLQGALVAVHPGNGEVIALVGGRDNSYAGFNRALDAVRSIGSLVKPAVYLTALADPSRYTLATLLDDSPIKLKNADGSVWEPQNYDKQFHGDVPLVMALAHSYNVPTVRLGMDLGVPNVVRTLERLGISRRLEAYPSLLLGAASLTPMEVTQMYQTIAANGFRTPLRSIRAVLDSRGEPLSRYPLTVAREFDETSIYLLTRALEMVVQQGTAAAVGTTFGESAGLAGKTGTTDDTRDSWFAGFGEDYLAVVWIGRDDNQSTGLTGSTGALPVWSALAQHVRPMPLQPAVPADLEQAWIDPVNGLLAEQRCEGAVLLPFAAGSAPHQQSQCVQQGMNWFRRLLQ